MKKIAFAACALMLLVPAVHWAQNPPPDKSKDKKPAKTRATAGGIKAPKRINPSPTSAVPAPGNVSSPASPTNTSQPPGGVSTATPGANPTAASGLTHVTTSTAPVLSVTGTINAGLWGFADLHAHPASHVSFGAKPDGSDGIFWGRPGMALASSNPMADMPACSPDSHYGFDADVVRKETRKAVISQLDSLTGYTHGSNGAPTFVNWPNAQSVVHQQMHISAIRRAYDGGLRLMIASVADTQMLSNLWSKIGFNLFGNSVPPVDNNFDHASAVRQLEYITRMVAANSGWMQIVTSAAQARNAISQNKLAIILSVEMDKLSADQILDLSRRFAVRHVVPIHLVNNSFGGCAVYGDLFNASNNYLNGSFFRVTNDTNLEFRLGRPSVLKSAELGAIKPVEVSDLIYLTLGYNGGTGGHRNVQGLNSGELLKLMRAGLLIDVAHMSQASTEQAVRLAEQYKYPMMNSHTGLRGPGETGYSERDMMRSHAQRLAALHGVIGLGTEGSSGMHMLWQDKKSPLKRFTNDDHLFTRNLNPPPANEANRLVFNLRVWIGTGDDDLRGGNNNADVIVNLRDGRKLNFNNVNRGQPWKGDMHSVTLPLPPGTTRSALAGFTIQHHSEGSFPQSPDNWDLVEVRFTCMDVHQDTIGEWLKEYDDARSLMHGRGVALGTDINGFAPQIPFCANPVSYPISVATRTDARPAGYNPPSLNRSVVGAKVFDFQKDGLAHYGMLPDMIQAVSQKPNGAQAVKALYHTAGDVVAMWDQVEAAQRNIH